MACLLVGAKPLSEPMMEYCLLGTNFSEIWKQVQQFSYKKWIYLQNGGQFVLVSVSEEGLSAEHPWNSNKNTG